MYVYFIEAFRETPLVKIGKAKNPEARLRNLQVGSPVKLKMIGQVKCKSDFHALQVEKFAHNLFYKQRRRGEWFRLSEKHREMLKRVVEKANE